MKGETKHPIEAGIVDPTLDKAMEEENRHEFDHENEDYIADLRADCEMAIIGGDINKKVESISKYALEVMKGSEFNRSEEPWFDPCIAAELIELAGGHLNENGKIPNEAEPIFRELANKITSNHEDIAGIIGAFRYAPGIWNEFNKNAISEIDASEDVLGIAEEFINQINSLRQIQKTLKLCKMESLDKIADALAKEEQLAIQHLKETGFDRRLWPLLKKAEIKEQNIIPSLENIVALNNEFNEEIIESIMSHLIDGNIGSEDLDFVRRQMASPEQGKLWIEAHKKEMSQRSIPVWGEKNNDQRWDAPQAFLNRDNVFGRSTSDDIKRDETNRPDDEMLTQLMDAAHGTLRIDLVGAELALFKDEKGFWVGLIEKNGAEKKDVIIAVAPCDHPQDEVNLQNANFPIVTMNQINEIRHLRLGPLSEAVKKLGEKVGLPEADKAY